MEQSWHVTKFLQMVWMFNVKEGIQMTSLQWDGSRFSEEAANPRGVKALAFKRS